MANFASKASHWIPLFQTVATYDRRWIANDLMAGLSGAAVQIPTAVAYAQLAGLPPITGLYTCIFPLVAYVAKLVLGEPYLMPDTFWTARS